MKILMSALLLVAAAVAADKPDFSGNWKMDGDKSVFGPMPPPASMTRTIELKGAEVSFKQTMTGPEMELTFKFFTDGRETVNSFMGADYKGTANWEGKTLVFHSRIESDAQFKSTSKWTLSDDGKTLTEIWSVSSAQGDLEVTYVLVKQ